MLKQRLRLYNDRNELEIVGVMIADITPLSHVGIQINPEGIIQFSEFVSIGISMCHKNDRYNKKYGENIAFERHYNFRQTQVLKERWSVWNVDRVNKKFEAFRYYDDRHDNIKKQIEWFLERCQRYYKDKSIIMPRIRWI
jgi:hypothetical protein